MGEIKLVRIYSHDQPVGYRILVDRLWPRGMSKIKANLDEWDKEIGPSTKLRKWFNHDEAKFLEFKDCYEKELEENPALDQFIATVKEKLANGDVLFLYGTKDKKVNQASILKEFVEKNF